MDVQAVSALLAALLILAIGASVLLRSRSDKMYTSFAAITTRPGKNFGFTDWLYK